MAAGYPLTMHYDRRHGFGVGGAIILCGLTLLAGCRRESQPAAARPQVSVIRLEARPLADDVTASGVIEAVDKAQVGFMVAGRVLRVAAEDGDTVSSGQLLAALDASDYSDALAIAEGRLAEIRARHARLTKLHELGSLTATDFDKINTALNEAESSVDLARRRVAYTELKAPFAGRVVRLGIAPGTVVAPGMPVFTVLAAAPVWAVLSVPEVDAPRIKVGQEAQVTLAAAGGSEVAGAVEAVLPQADALSRSFAVKIRLANADGRFRAGNVVSARIVTGRSRPAFTLPPQAVQRYADGGLYVWTVDAARHTVAHRIVGIGRARETEVEIVSGLQPGDLVVSAGVAPLIDGMEVAFPNP